MANVLQKRLFNNLQFSNKLYRLNQLRNTLCRSFYRQSAKSNRKYDSHLSWFAFAGAFATGVGTIYWLNIKPSKIKTPFLLSAASEEEEVVEEKTDLTVKQMKFEDYASYEYGGKRLMSPKDFLDSLVNNKQDSAKNKKILTTQDINKILKSTQQLSKHREDLFTYVGENGIITYPEYLFLLTLLTKSSHGLHVAFRMLDLDGNETLGRTEFQELEKMLNKKTSAKSMNETANSPETMTLPNTSLLIYFFGVAGNGQLTFNDMLHFTKNLQREFWKREFLLHSASKGVIDGEQFAKLLLQSTQLTDKDIKEYVERLKSRQTSKINVSLQDYVKFGEFINNLEEFSISLKIYNVANQPVTQEEFKRAVLISTGDVLGDHIVNTVFQLFDIDGDGKLSQKEFLGLMKDRVNKRFATRANNLGFWGGFTNCVKAELVK